MIDVVLNLGSSLGQKKTNLKLAVLLLDCLPNSSVAAISRLYASPPMGPCNGGFLNISIVLKTSLPPEKLLHSCQAIEKRLGRVKSYRWSDRIIDIDILFYGDHQRCSTLLTVPHPGVLQRGFAYMPTLEIRPDLRHPSFDLPLANLLSPPDWPAWPVGVLSLAGHH